MEGGEFVSASSYDDENFEWARIDKYSKKIIDHAAIDIIRSRKAKKRKEDFVNYDIDLIAETEAYINDYIISDNYGHSGKVSTEWLYEAMLNLDDNLRAVLILKFWYKYSRREMSKTLHVSEKTITNWKNRVFDYIKNYRSRILNRDIRGP